MKIIDIFIYNKTAAKIFILAVVVFILFPQTLFSKSTSCANKEGSDYPQKNISVKLSNGNVFVVKCYSHDAVLTSCEISMYNSKGEIDKNFKSPFLPLKSGFWGMQNRIDGVICAAESKTSKGNIEITGWFQYEKLDQIPDSKRDFCIDEDCVGFDGYSTKAKLTFDSNGNITETKILKLAKLTYTNNQIINELRKQIPLIETKLKETSGQQAEYYKDKLKTYKQWLEELK